MINFWRNLIISDCLWWSWRQRTIGQSLAECHVPGRIYFHAETFRDSVHHASVWLLTSRHVANFNNYCITVSMWLCVLHDKSAWIIAGIQKRCLWSNASVWQLYSYIQCLSNNIATSQETCITCIRLVYRTRTTQKRCFDISWTSPITSACESLKGCLLVLLQFTFSTETLVFS